MVETSAERQHEPDGNRHSVDTFAAADNETCPACGEEPMTKFKHPNHPTPNVTYVHRRTVGGFTTMGKCVVEVQGKEGE